MNRFAVPVLAAAIALAFNAHGQEQAAAPVAAAAPITNAQALVNRTVARHPEIIELDVHAHAPGAPSSTIIAAKAAQRIGKASDRDDLEVARTGEARVEINRERDQNVEVEVPLLDTRRRTIGSVEITFPYIPGFDEQALILKAQRIRDELVPDIMGVAQLVEPAPAQLAAASGRPAERTEEDYNKPELGNQQSLPMTKAVVSGKELESASQDGYSEAVKNVAGVAPANSKGSPNDSIYIRGIKLNLFSNYRLNGGLPTAGVITTPNEDKTRVEALKGANALMFGVASPAGIINLVTKRAEDRDVSTLLLSGNAFGQYGFAADVGRRFGDDKEVGLRVNLSDTHLENGVRHMGGHGDFESIGFDAKITDRLSINGDVEHYTKHVPEQAGISIPAVVNNQVVTPEVPDPRKLLSGTWAMYTPKTTNIQGRFDYILTDNWKILGESGKSDAARQRFTVRISNYNVNTGANGTVAVNYVQQRYRNTFNRLETLGTFSTWFLDHKLTLGAAQNERDSVTPFQTNVTLPQRQNIYDPIMLNAPIVAQTTGLPTQTSKDFGVYGYDTVSIGPQVKVLLGIRRTVDKEDNGVRRSSVGVKSPAAGVLYDILPTTTLFASVMRGLEVGATAPVSAVNAYEILAPAISRQEEIGVRTSYFGGLSLSGSYFKITRANPVTNPITRIFANSGELNYNGVEVTASYDITKRFSIATAAQWLKVVQDSPNDPTVNGLIPENTAKWVGNISFSYRPEFVPGLTLTAGSNAISHRQINNQDQGTIPGYVLFTASANYTTRIYGKRTAFQVSLDNIGNLRYWNSVQTGTFGTGMDRAVRFSARVDL